MKEFLVKLMGGILFLALVFFLIWFGIYMKRNINYRFMYRDLVEKTVREMVKPEALK